MPAISFFSCRTPLASSFSPAKRLLVFPDQLELVWFDDFEFDNPAFALYVAGYPGTGERRVFGLASQTQELGGKVYRTHAHVGKLGN